MKQDHDLTPKKDNSEGNKSKSASNAQAAMTNYFEDVFGGMQSDPLKALQEEQAPSRQKRELSDSPAESGRVLKKSKSHATKKVEFAEREHKPLLQQVVIPAAFPKMPPKEKVEEKVSVREKLSQKVTGVTVASTEQEKSVPVEENKLNKTIQPEVEQETIETKAEPSAEEVQAPKDTSETNVELDIQLESADIHEPAPWLQNGRPSWGQERFECLLFTVAGLKLAVPLVSLGSIYKIEHEFTPLVGRAEWFMGLYQAQDRNVQVVDTARWVMPDRYHDQIKDKYQFIIRLGGNNWGIACDQVHEAISLEPSQVRWRSERSKRPWLSGTVIEQMCALLDADTLSYLLQKDIKIH